MSVQPKPYLAPEEYLVLERQAETKNEYYIARLVLLKEEAIEYAG